MMELSPTNLQAQVDDLMRHRFPDVPQRLYPIAEVKETSVSAMHGQFFFNQERWEQVAAGLINKIWMLAVNDTGRPLYTSDHPVVNAPTFLTTKPAVSGSTRTALSSSCRSRRSTAF